VIACGVQTWGTDVTALQRYWRGAEDLGYARVVYGDGPFPWTYDGFTMLGALAALTTRVRLGPAVTYAFDAAAHHPAWLATRAATVDHLSGGRLDLRFGVGASDAATGAAWRRHGIPYPAPAERLARLATTIARVRALWRGEPLDAGPDDSAEGARREPGPVQPAPPVWVAAMGPRALALAARLADGWEASYVSPGAFATRWAHVQSHLTTAGRTPGALRRAVETDVVIASTETAARAAIARFRAVRGLPHGHPLLDGVLAGTPARVRARVADYAAVGVTDLTLGFADFPDTGMLALFAEAVLPEVSAGPRPGR
jgi:alkanesulfonate monooxygenase SsuD/methylene tetrahydromethanopterin reductase-like flavin-dependent oxidoreductase (luciferase family)